MSEQPREFDAVLGGNNPPPVMGVVLGGIEGVKRRLESEIVDVRIKALSDALNYGEAGLDLVIEALEDDSLQVKGFAVRLLKERGGEKGKRALLEFDPYLYFTKLDDWEAVDFNYEVGIINPEGKAYVVNLEKLKLLIQDDRVNEVEALICYLQNHSYKCKIYQEYYDFVNTIFDNRRSLSNLKALFLGDEQRYESRQSYFGIGDINLLLEGYPNLEILHLRGCCNHLECSILGHDNLKTLVIETTYIGNIEFQMMCSLNLPALEYLDLWIDGCFEIEIGRQFENSLNNVIKNLKPILFSESFPKLSYLGIHSSKYADEIANAITESSFMADNPIIDHLLILDLSMGNLSDEGLETLLEVPSLSNLYTFNISHNYVTKEFIEEVEQLSPPDCCLIAHPQNEDESSMRYWALSE